MRLDQYLKVTRLVPRRSIAGELCRQGNVTVNGLEGKAGRAVRTGDRIKVRLPGRELTVEVLAVPAMKNVPRAEAASYYALRAERRFDFWGREIDGAT